MENTKHRVGKFEKISLEQWHKDYGDDSEGISNGLLENVIKVPTRATSDSAGYDFVTPFDIDLQPGEYIKVPTGIKCSISSGWFLAITPKSGLGFKYHTRLTNSIGIIDADYYNNEGNEGHIWVKMQNDCKDKALHIDAGKAFCQGIFLQYGITVDDEADGERVGGLGSTNA